MILHRALAGTPTRLYAPLPDGVEDVTAAAYLDEVHVGATPVSLSGVAVEAGWATGVLNAATMSSGTVTWETGLGAFIEQGEVVGGRFLTVEEVRRRQPERFTAWTDPQVTHAITEVEVACEDIMGFALVPRAEHHVEYLPGVTCHLMLGRYPVNNVESVTLDGEPIDAPGWRLEPGPGVMHLETLWKGDVDVVYTHGWARPPADLTDHFLTHLRYVLQADQRIMPGQAISQIAAEGMRLQLARAGVDGHLGIPDVDAAYCRYAETRTWLGS